MLFFLYIFITCGKAVKIVFFCSIVLLPGKYILSQHYEKHFQGINCRLWSQKTGWRLFWNSIGFYHIMGAARAVYVNTEDRAPAAAIKFQMYVMVALFEAAYPIKS